MVSSPSLSSLPGTNGLMVVTTELVTFTLPEPRQAGHRKDPDTFVLFSSPYSNTTPFPPATLAHGHTGRDIPGLRVIHLFHPAPPFSWLILHLIPGDT